MKSIELTQSQIKALQSGATMFILPISDYDLNIINKGYSIGDSFPINKGNKDIFVKEEFMEVLDRRPETKGEKYYFYKSEYRQEDYHISPSYNVWDSLENEFDKHIAASQMTKEQSRYSFKECIDVRIVRVQDILISDCEKILNIYSAYFNVTNPKIRTAIINKFKAYYNQQMKELNIDRTYEDNDYVFLAEFA